VTSKRRVLSTMLTLFTLIGVGFLLGLRHATDADHVVAVSTIVTREPNVRAAMLLGALWGVGHTLTIVLVGTVLIVFGIVIPERVGLALEMVVGVMLVGLGVWALLGAYRAGKTQRASAEHLRHHAAEQHIPQLRRSYVAVTPQHAHTHAHGDYVHTHVHGHGHGAQAHGHALERTPTQWLDRHFGGWSWYQWLRPIVIGIVHGLAGSASVVLLVLASTRDAGVASSYLLAFGLGTVLGMAALTSVMAAPLAMAARRIPRFGQQVRMLAGAASVGLGLFMILQLSEFVTVQATLR
jgi:high-affinity nickel-transport protein